MSFKELINNDIKQAMLAKDKVKLEAVRAIKAAIIIAETDKGGGEVDDTTAAKMLQKLFKQRKDAAEVYISQNRQDLADVELDQAKVIEAYLPKQLSEDDVKKEIASIISQIGASGMKDMGKVMGMASKQLAGKADNKLVSELVKQLLS